MAAKTFICKICSEEVSKPKSYAYEDGRACREHQEAVDANAISEQKKAKDLASHKDNPRRHSEHYTHGAYPMFKNFRDPNEYCWHCDKAGVYSNVVAERLLVNMSKINLLGKGECNPFDNDSPHFELTRKDLDGKVVIKRFPLPADYSEWKIKQLVNGKDNSVMLVNTTKLVVLCPHCAEEYNFDWDYDRPNIPLSILQIVGDIAKVAGDEIAMKEILKDIADGIPL